MREITGNLWDYHDKGFWVCITTNGALTNDERAVMGRGTAEQAKHRFPDLPRKLGRRIVFFGNHVSKFAEERLFSFPVKHHWREKADLDLICRSCDELTVRLQRSGIEEVILPRPGCGNGGLDWYDVRDRIFERLDDRVLIITHPSQVARARHA